MQNPGRKIMKKLIFVFIALALTIVINQSILCSKTFDIEPQQVHRLVYVEETHQWYVDQARIWKEELKKHPDNPKAWNNYFMANKYSHWQGDVTVYKNLMDSILTEMGKNVSDSYEYNYLRYYNGERDVSLLEKAYRKDPTRADALYEFMMHYEHSGDYSKLKRYCEELYQTKDIAPGLLNYNYNALISTDMNSILFTNGDNDTYPGWVLQKAKGIREDVSILNLHLTFVDRTYLDRKLKENGINLDVESFSKDKMNLFLKELAQAIEETTPDIPIYVATTVYDKSLKEVEEDLYLVGLALKYSTKRFNNMESIKFNVYNKLRLDYLNYDWYSEDYLINRGLNRLHMNYVVLFLKLGEELHKTGSATVAGMWKERALQLAQRADNQKSIDHIKSLAW
jgi:hypothetical protein